VIEPTATELDPDRLPRHIAIIMDGNSRWARLHGVSRAAGHEAGALAVRRIVEAARALERVEVLSLYTFSTENWRRSKTEVNALFALLSKYIRLELENIHKENIRFNVIGRREGLSKKTLRELNWCMDHTRNNTAMVLNLAINYGGRAELADAARAIAEEVQRGELSPAEVDEDCVARHLYAPELPDPDLLIRTAGELRLSNFMMWQLSYAEIVSMDTLWPDFDKDALARSILEYQSRQRRFGGR
jgi:undecaprenyl diphosphate synthase